MTNGKDKYPWGANNLIREYIAKKSEFDKIKYKE
jgi:hypothetical protein